MIVMVQGPDPTPWELLRAMQQMRDDLRSDFADFAARLAEMVTTAEYAADRRADDIRMTALEREAEDARQERVEDQQRAAAARRLAVTALVAPLVVSVLAAVILAKLGL
ncbi:hypothetical protein [Streptomyces sp. NPDC088925]|uniref:hypothetical protein n=1 Tax=Streptomyces sp. NPDC088925 TaxID=3365914 RepID=UPI00380B77ED